MQNFIFARRVVCFFSLILLAGILHADELAKTNDAPPKISSPPDGELAIKKFKVATNLQVTLFAAEPLLANPVSFSIDEQGRFFIVETFRLHEGVSDIRGHMDWLDDELASKTTADHLLKLKKYLGKEFEKLTEKSERVQLVEDTDGDGKADKSTLFAEGFNGAGAGLAEGILARRGDIYFTCIPDLYLLRDKNGDGKADEKKSLQTGYGIRTAFLGHDLHGLRFGPDGKLYFSCGDRGFSIEQNGKTIASPETGAVLRCNPDGSGLEIFATGLRNPQELAFDQYGNLFTGDNNSDAGDEARWVYLVEGGDSGWRIGWQFINSPNARGPWNSEKMWEPKSALEVGYIVPPIANIASGPSGVTHNPGVSALPKEFDKHFFLCDFRGSESSLVHSFALEPKGATFELVDHKDFIAGPLVTDVDFGPDGNLYISDWVSGWGMTGKGRIYKISNSDLAKSELVLETKKLISEGMGKRSVDELAKLLSHPDQRVRQEAQFTLAERGETKIFASVAKNQTNQLARLHAIWGLGQIANAKKFAKRRDEISKVFIELFSEKDAEVLAQIAKISGDAKFPQAFPKLVTLLQDVKNPRAQFFSAMALGKIGNRDAVKPVLEMLRANNDADPLLRHAGVMALVWLNDQQAVAEAAKDNSASVRLAALIAMRHWGKPELAQFLSDKQQNIVTEAARAINDLPVTEALPELAKLIERPNYEESFFRRVLNANFRLGTAEAANALAKFAARKDAPEKLRVEALEMLADWKNPSGRDRVTGLWRPVSPRDSALAITAINPFLIEILQTAPASVQIAAIKLANGLGINDVSPALFELVANKKIDAAARVEALKVLANRNDAKLAEAVEIAAADEHEILRKEALPLQAKLKPANAENPLEKALATGTIGEKQSALAALGELKDEQADKILGEWLDNLLAGKVATELQLDLLEAAAQRNNAEIKSKLEKFKASRSEKDDLSNFRECLAGGDAAEGKKIFFEKVEASCVRCHKIGSEGGEVGPNLSKIGGEKPREYLLESIVVPNKQIAPGFESVLVTLKNGTAYAGILKTETETELTLNSPEDGIVKVAKKDIDKRERGLSGMLPELAQVLSKRDLRNVVEFLASQK